MHRMSLAIHPRSRMTLLIYREIFVKACCLWVAILIPSSVTHHYHSTRCYSKAITSCPFQRGTWGKCWAGHCALRGNFQSSEGLNLSALGISRTAQQTHTLVCLRKSCSVEPLCCICKKKRYLVTEYLGVTFSYFRHGNSVQLQWATFVLLHSCSLKLKRCICKRNPSSTHAIDKA